MIIEQLAFSLNRRDEGPNIQLAEKIAASNNSAQIAELFSLLEHKNKSISSDAIKVLGEIALRKPGLIKTYIPNLLLLLNSRNNRLQWGAMAALDNVTVNAYDRIFNQLPVIIQAAESGSVITRDRCVFLLVKLAGHEKYSADAVAWLFEILIKAPDNQFAMYAEELRPLLKKEEFSSFEKILRERLSDLPKDSQVKRVQKVLASLKPKKS